MSWDTRPRGRRPFRHSDQWADHFEGVRQRYCNLQDDQSVVHHATRATAQMWIESPLERDRKAEQAQARGEATGGPKKGTWLNRAFDTHPPLEERIAALEAM